MITIIPFKEKKANIFNVKKDLNELQKFIDLYNLESKGIHKSFFKNNCLVISNEFITKTCADLMKNFLPYTYFKTIDFSHSGFHVGSKGILKDAAKKNANLTLILNGKEALGSSMRR